MLIIYVNIYIATYATKSEARLQVVYFFGKHWHELCFLFSEPQKVMAVRRCWMGHRKVTLTSKGR